MGACSLFEILDRRGLAPTKVPHELLKHAVIFTFVATFGCGAKATEYGFAAVSGNAGVSSSGGGGPGGTVGNSGVDGGIFIPTASGSSTGSMANGSVVSGALTIMPLAPVVNVVTGQPAPTVQFTAYLQGMQTGAAWTLDRGELGTVSATGVFTPTGTSTGTGNITAAVGSAVATTTVTSRKERSASGPWTTRSPPIPRLRGGQTWTLLRPS
jgi:hypothetical protein